MFHTAFTKSILIIKQTAKRPRRTWQLALASAVLLISICAQAQANTAPILQPIGDWSIDEGNLLTFTAQATDSDGDTYNFSLINAPMGASIHSLTGAFTWTPSEAQGPSSHAFTVRVSDGNLFDEETVTVTVNEINTAPLLQPIGNMTVDEGSLLTFTAQATDSDLPGNTLTYSLIGSPTGATINSVTGAFTWTPSEAQGGQTYIFTVMVSDGALTDEEEIAITVNAVNSAPVIDPIADASAQEHQLFTVQVVASDSDLPANTLTYSLSAAPAGMTIDETTGWISWTPTEVDGGTTVIVTVLVSDGELSATASFQIVVAETNTAPAISGTPLTSAAIDQAYSFTPSAVDTDGDTLNYSATGLPAWLSLNAATGEISGTPSAQDTGSSQIVLTVDDGNGGTDSLSWALSVVVQVGDISALWLQEGLTAKERFGSAVSLFDMTGDNRAEVTAGAAQRTQTASGKKMKNAGGVDLLASSNGARVDAYVPALAKQRFGSAVAVVADQNNDGVADLVVGKTHAGKGGEIALHSGSDGSLIRNILVSAGSAAPLKDLLCNSDAPITSAICEMLINPPKQGARLGDILTWQM